MELQCLPGMGAYCGNQVSQLPLACSVHACVQGCRSIDRGTYKMTHDETGYSCATTTSQWQKLFVVFQDPEKVRGLQDEVTLMTDIMSFTFIKICFERSFVARNRVAGTLPVYHYNVRLHVYLNVLPNSLSFLCDSA